MAATTTGIRPGTATSDRQALLGRLARSLQVPQSSLEVSEVAELSSAVRARAFSELPPGSCASDSRSARPILARARTPSTSTRR